VLVVGLGSSGSSGSRRKARLERRLKKSRLDTSKTLYREFAITLCYYRRLASGASNPNIIKMTYYMRTLDKQVLDLKN
jgi:hypothetical protein